MRRRQSGMMMVELAFAGLTFLVLLFGAIEIARMAFVWNTLDEATRRGARVAAVCPVNAPEIRQVAIFGDPGSTGDGSTIVPNLTTDHISVSYLDENGDALSDPTAQFGQIRYVRVGIGASADGGGTAYQHDLLIPGFTRQVTADAFATTLPRESLGVSPEGTGCSFGA